MPLLELMGFQETRLWMLTYRNRDEKHDQFNSNSLSESDVLWPDGSEAWLIWPEMHQSQQRDLSMLWLASDLFFTHQQEKNF